jgi:hypothetical protein
VAHVRRAGASRPAGTLAVARLKGAFLAAAERSTIAQSRVRNRLVGNARLGLAHQSAVPDAGQRLGRLAAPASNAR